MPDYRHGRYGLGAGVDRPGDADDARPGPVLRRHGAAEERARDAHAELHHPRGDLGPVGALRVQPGLRPRQGRPHRRPRMVRARTASVPRADADYAPTIPHIAFMVFQMMFAVITPALISGAFAERMKFSAYLVFTSSGRPSSTTRWPTGSGADGWLGREARRARLRGRHGRPHHAGVAALVAALVIGKRAGYGTDAMSAAQPPDGLTRRGRPLVRLVRVQRR